MLNMLYLITLVVLARSQWNANTIGPRGSKIRNFKPRKLGDGEIDSNDDRVWLLSNPKCFEFEDDIRSFKDYLLDQYDCIEYDDDRQEIYQHALTPTYSAWSVWLEKANGTTLDCLDDDIELPPPIDADCFDDVFYEPIMYLPPHNIRHHKESDEDIDFGDDDDCAAQWTQVDGFDLWNLDVLDGERDDYYVFPFDDDSFEPCDEDEDDDDSKVEAIILDQDVYAEHNEFRYCPPKPLPGAYEPSEPANLLPFGKGPIRINRRLIDTQGIGPRGIGPRGDFGPRPIGPRVGDSPDGDDGIRLLGKKSIKPKGPKKSIKPKGPKKPRGNKSPAGLPWEHGTVVAGILVGHMTGAAKTTPSSYFPVCKYDEGKNETNQTSPCHWTDIEAGYNAAIEHMKQNSDKRYVINYSVGGPRNETLDVQYNKWGKQITEAGGIWVVAAGNSDIDACDLSPAFSPWAITVGAYDMEGNRAIFPDSAQNASNYGGCVDVWGPGLNISSALTNSTESYGVDGYGTSYSTPAIAGLTANLLKENEEATLQEIKNYFWEKARFVEDEKHGIMNQAYLECDGDVEIW